jgi:hypothetical protein
MLGRKSEPSKDLLDSTFGLLIAFAYHLDPKLPSSTLQGGLPTSADTNQKQAPV